MLPSKSTGTTTLTALGILLGTTSHVVYAQSTSSGSDDSNDCSILNNVQFYYYGVPTNNNGTAVAYACGDSQHSAGGNGTLEAPLTIAADTESGEFEQCEVLYSPTLRKYLQVKDPCLDCGRDGINVWLGGDEEDDEGQAQCNAEIATSEGVLIQNPAESYQDLSKSIEADPIWADSTCHKDNIYKGAEGECIEDTETSTTPAAASSTSASSTNAAGSEISSTSSSTTSAAASETSTSSSQDSTSEADSTSDQLSAGAIAGIVIGSIGAMALIAIAVLLWRRRSRDGHHGEEKGPLYHEMPANTHHESQELDSSALGFGMGMAKTSEHHTSRYDPVELPANEQHFASDLISPLSPERISQV
ncbi:hypothetical protein LIA77_05566 [Sarocladium implicatum]|nr:hypothetical protein LIA77_05566 [Sarocladium implicatum]